MDVTNIAIKPHSVVWGEDTFMVQTITCVADVASSLNNKYFFITNAAGTRFHVWYNVASAGTDPAPGGSTAAVVAISAGATASAVATATEAVIEALSGLDSTVSGAVITVTNSAAGYAPLSSEGVGTGFTFALTTEGDTAADIGFVDGDIEFSIPEDKVDITAHQTGTNVLSQIRTGKQVEVTITFKETSKAQLLKLIRQAGGTHTPAGANATEVGGYGTYRDFTQTLNQSRKLVLHPVVKGTSDHTEDYTFHYAYPQVEKLTLSGENIFMVPVTFKCYPKTALNDRVEYFAFGDGTQTLT